MNRAPAEAVKNINTVADRHCKRHKGRFWERGRIEKNGLQRPDSRERVSNYQFGGYGLYSTPIQRLKTDIKNRSGLPFFGFAEHAGFPLDFFLFLPHI